MKWCLVSSLALLLLSVALPAGGYPNGAPQNRKVCRTLKPRHRHDRGQTSSAPYSVTPAKTKIPVGGSVNITISAHSGNSYKGFIIQARPRMIANVEFIRPIGTFRILDSKNSKTLECLSGGKNTVTHTSPAAKTSTSFIWTSPPKYKGPVYFRVTFVKDFSTFWLNVSSKIEVNGTKTGDPESIVLEPPEEELTSSESSSESLFLSEEIYEECGSTKACFGLPNNCVSEGSCYALATVAVRDSKFEFELMGENVKYVSVILSENGEVNADSVTTCAYIDNKVKLQEAPYNKYHVVGSQSNSNDGTLINSSYVDGVLYCKFLREEAIEFNSVHYDLKNSQYFLILAAGNVKNDKETINFEKMQFYVSSRKKYLSDVSGFIASTTSNSIPKQKHWFQVKFFDWFFGIFDYFTMLR